MYDMKPLFEKLPVFRQLQKDPALFTCSSVDTGGYGILGDDELDFKYATSVLEYEAGHFRRKVLL